MTAPRRDLAGQACTELATTLLDAAGFEVSLAESISAGEEFAAGELIRCARRSRILGQAIVTGALHAELAAGATWAQAAAGLGVDEAFARSTYEQGYLAWLDGEPAALLPGLPPHLSAPPVQRWRITPRDALARIGAARTALAMRRTPR